MSKPFPVFCRDCKWSRAPVGTPRSLRCLHPVVNAKDSWALAVGESEHSGSGSDCRSERDRGWFSPCGMRGKLWDAK